MKQDEEFGSAEQQTNQENLFVLLYILVINLVCIVNILNVVYKDFDPSSVILIEN